MKIRLGFVSNSSCSSFICQVSGDVAISGHDGGYDQYVATCAKGHEIFAAHILKDVKPSTVEQKREELAWCFAYCSDAFQPLSKEDKSKCKGEGRWEGDSVGDLSEADIEEVWDKLDRKAIEKIFNKDWEEYGIDGYPTYCCPICQFTTVSQDNVMAYLLAEKFGSSHIGRGLEIARKEIIEKFGDLKAFEEHLKKST